jgi:hypothetical protein
MTNRTLTALRATLLESIDTLAFAAPATRPALRLAIDTQFTVYRAVINAAPALCLCALCDEPTASIDLAPLDTEYTYVRATRQHSFERYDDLCPACREAMEAEYGRDEYDAGDYWRC